jgi:hypothetical protein
MTCLPTSPRWTAKLATAHSSSRRVSVIDIGNRVGPQTFCAGGISPDANSRPQPEDKAMQSSSERDPRYHTQKMQARLKETIEHLRKDIEKVDEPQLKAMFETSAEVLGGLAKAFQDYECRNESAWQ